MAAAAALLVGILGAFATDLGPWYQGLDKPAWQPPDWLFGPIWTSIFGLTAAAGAVGWRTAPGTPMRRRIILLFALNGLLNVLWTVLFFRLHRPDWALLEVGLLWLSIVLLVIHLRRCSSLAAWLMVPYLLWVSFAALLNFEIVRLNGPFAA